jgi:hypothetical protein
MNIKEASDDQYALLFDVRRSIRYHDRRKSFFELIHRISAGLTVLLAGSVLFEMARPGETALWMILLASVAALLSAWDIVIGYASRANLHHDLKKRFIKLEIDILSGDSSDSAWSKHQVERLRIEQDEPPIFRALDLLCRNEVLKAEGFSLNDDKTHFTILKPWPRITRHIFHWADLSS